MQEPTAAQPKQLKAWVSPKLRRIVSGSAEFGTGQGADGSSTS
jgi:hypothetical protein